MSDAAHEVPQRADVVEMLAAFGDRTPDQVPEGVDSMELAWLAHQLEQRYGIRLDDDALARMTTVTGVLRVLAEPPVLAELPADPYDRARPTPERGD